MLIIITGPAMRSVPSEIEIRRKDNVAEKRTVNATRENRVGNVDYMFALLLVFASRSHRSRHAAFPDVRISPMILGIPPLQPKGQFRT